MIGLLPIFLVFAIVVALMVSGRVPAIFGLIILAIGISLAGGIPFTEVHQEIIGKGVMLLQSTIAAGLFAGILAQVVKNTGIAEHIIRRAAELGGDNPFWVAVFTFLACIFAFVGLSGTGSVILLGTIALPVVISIGVPRRLAAALVLIGCFLGYTMNVYRWQFIMDITGAQLEIVRQFSMAFIVPGIILGVIVIFIGTRSDRAIFQWAVPKAEIKSYERVPFYALLTPVIPLILVAGLKIEMLTSFMIAMVYGIVTTQWKKKFAGVWDLVSRSAFDGISDMSLFVVLCFGVGMLVKAAMHPAVAEQLGTIIERVTPTTALGVILFFGVVAPPLTQYRGPMNPWGMGAALAGIMAEGPLHLGILAAGFWVLDFVVGISCPTSSQVVWTSTYAGKSPVELQRLTLPISWLLAIIGMIVAVLMFPLLK